MGGEPTEMLKEISNNLWIGKEPFPEADSR